MWEVLVARRHLMHKFDSADFLSVPGVMKLFSCLFVWFLFLVVTFLPQSQFFFGKLKMSFMYNSAAE